MEDSSLQHAIESLEKNISALDKNICKDISFGRSFLLSIVRWIGYTMGATIVASLVVLVLSTVFDYASDIPVVGQYFGSGSFQEIFGDSNIDTPR